MKTITLGRWTAELYGRALHIYRRPDPNCHHCHGEGGYEVLTDGPAPAPDYDLCTCWNPDRGLRIPLAPKRRRQMEVPF